MARKVNITAPPPEPEKPPEPARSPFAGLDRSVATRPYVEFYDPTPSQRERDEQADAIRYALRPPGEASKEAVKRMRELMDNAALQNVTRGLGVKSGVRAGTPVAQAGAIRVQVSTDIRQGDRISLGGSSVGRVLSVAGDGTAMVQLGEDPALLKMTFTPSGGSGTVNYSVGYDMAADDHVRVREPMDIPLVLDTTCPRCGKARTPCKAGNLFCPVRLDAADVDAEAPADLVDDRPITYTPVGTWFGYTNDDRVIRIPCPSCAGKKGAACQIRYEGDARRPLYCRTRIERAQDIWRAKLDGRDENVVSSASQDWRIPYTSSPYDGLVICSDKRVKKVACQVCGAKVKVACKIEVMYPGESEVFSTGDERLAGLTRSTPYRSLYHMQRLQRAAGIR